MSYPHPRAVGSLGAEAEEWLADIINLRLRYWQRLAMRRQLEVDADGNLVWRTVIESTPRRSGKSTLIRALAMWRLHQADRFGEEQLILLTGKDLPIVREIIRRGWPWAHINGFNTRKANGQEEIENPDGSRWVVRGRDSVFGYDVGFGVVDEAWAVDVSVVDDGLEPALLERMQPQLMLTSTAHRKATPLMRVRREAAMDQLASPTETLLLHWGAAEDANIQDRRAWREASAHWTADREVWMESSLKRMLAGEGTLGEGETDPAEAFKAQLLNIWPPKAVKEDAHWMPSDVLSRCGVRDQGALTPRPGAVAAIEVSVDGSSWSAAVCDGEVATVKVGGTLAECVAWAVAMGPSEVLAHQAVIHQLPVVPSELKPVTTGEATAAVGVLAAAVRSRSVRWDNHELLAIQFANIVVVPSPGGPRFGDRVSRGPINAAKAVSWAYWRSVTSMGEASMVF